MFLGIKSAEFTKYVTCPKCHEIYTYSESIERVGSRERSKNCCACNSLLLRTIETQSGKRLLCPHQTYCYYSLKKSLQDLLKRPGFMNHCKLWFRAWGYGGDGIYLTHTQRAVREKGRHICPPGKDRSKIHA